MKKKLLFLVIFAYNFQLFANQPKSNYELYGFVRNDFYYNSRLNEEVIDGIFQFYPKPALINELGIDKNEVPQANMISIATRIGLNIHGLETLGAKTSGKIEVDFAGAGTTFYLIRIRQAYMQFDWKKTAFLMGQTWHPMFGTVFPDGMSLNAGVPFQPFNRSPQLRITHHLNKHVKILGAALYQMQYPSDGPIGFSPNYMRNSLIPNLFGGIEFKNSNWISGVGLDYKKIKPDHLSISSIGAMAYTQFSHSKFTAKAKAMIIQNPSDHLMTGGYGKSFDSNSGGYSYTNLNTFSSWINVMYGKKWQIGIFGGYLQNLGSGMPLLAGDDGFTIYGRGFYSKTQEMLNRLVRVAPMLIFNLPNFTIGVEYNLTNAQFGTIQSDGKVAAPYAVNNHRIIGSASYFF